MSSEFQLTLPAFAKINLRLHVTGRRADGYHDLDTVFQTISLHDTIELRLIDGPHIILSGDDRTLTNNDENLVIRAAKSLQAFSGADQGARIRLQKRIPMQAGLGGGSSDAAATLIGLSRLWRLDLAQPELATIGSHLGADVAVFFFGGSAHAAGIGDQIEILEDVAERFLLIVKPNANINTADAYAALDERSLTSHNSKTILSSSRQSADSDKIGIANLTNDFEAVVFELEPEIRRAKNALMQAGANAALLAGSGSAVFGVFDSEDAQRRAIQAIELETGWRVFPCRTVGRQEYRDALSLS